jgi:hypothetical protein
MKAFCNFLFTTALCCAAPAVAQQTGVITELTGPATVRTPYSAPYVANLNTSLASGYVVTTGPGTHAEIRYAGAALRLGGDSEVEFVSVDPRALVLNLMYGSLDALLRAPETAQAFELRAPQGRALALDAGNYRFDLPRAGDTLGISVWQGAVRFEGPSTSLNVIAGSRIELRTGTGLSYNLADLPHDAFDEWAFALDRREETTFAEQYEGPIAAPPAVAYAPPIYVYPQSGPVFVYPPLVQRPRARLPRAHSHSGFGPSSPHPSGRTFGPGLATNEVRPAVPAAVPGAQPVLPPAGAGARPVLPPAGAEAQPVLPPAGASAQPMLPPAGALPQPSVPDGRVRAKGRERFKRSVQ